MTRTSVITAEEGRELNFLAQSINPILFWTCNYEPTLSYALSEDALFLSGIQDLYKFAIDANCVLKGLAFNSKNSICSNLFHREDAKQLRDAIDTIQVLRSVIDHNQSDFNGRTSAARVEAYVAWVGTHLGKSEPTSEKDFRTLNASLREMGGILVSLSRKAIGLISGRSDSKRIADKWIEAVIRWYCSGVHQEYYRGQLSDFYIAKACATRSNFNIDMTSGRLFSNVNRWISMQTTSQYDIPLGQLERERKEIDGASMGPLQQELAEKYPEIFATVAESQNKRLLEIDDEIERLKKARADFESMYEGKKVEYFFNAERLSKQLHESLKAMQEADERLTLLPQDFLQFDIERHFDCVQLP